MLMVVAVVAMVVVVKVKELDVVEVRTMFTKTSSIVCTVERIDTPVKTTAFEWKAARFQFCKYNWNGKSSDDAGTNKLI